MSLSIDEVRGLATLTRLALSEEELEQRREELERILAYVDRLQNVDTSGVPETESADEPHAWREDEPIACDEITRERIIANFPDRVGELLKVPAVFENPKS